MNEWRARLLDLISSFDSLHPQVGAILPGFKLSYSPGPRVTVPAAASGDARLHSDAAALLHVYPTVLPTPVGWNATFSAHLVLVFSGVPRLAKHLLQAVLAKWYLRDAATVAVVDALCATAVTAAAAVSRGDLGAVGAAMDAYWTQKRALCADAEPALLARLLAKVRPLAHGAVVAGAGGGGFICLLTKAPHARAAVAAALAEEIATDGVTLHAATVADHTVDADGTMEWDT